MCEAQMSVVKLKWVWNELNPGIGIYRWMEDEILNFLQFFSNFLELQRSKTGKNGHLQRLP